MTAGDAANDSRWLLVLGALLAAVIFVYPLSLDIPLLDPDEGFHAAVAQEMVERGDWVVPSLLGQPFLDKPILYSWAEALSLRVFGFSEAAVRLPGLLFALLGAVTTAIVGWRMFGLVVGLLAGVFYTTMILPTALAQAAAHDVALIPWINLALLLFWESEKRGHAASLFAEADRSESGPCGKKAPCLLFLLAIGVLLGLSVLTKGLVGVALVGVGYGCYLLVTRRLTMAVCLRGAVALGIAAAVASAWYIAVELRNPGYLYYFFVERHLLGFAIDTQSHGGEAWWYYLPILLGGGLPWIAYLPIVALDNWTRRKGSGFRDQEAVGSRQKVVGSGWSRFGFLFFRLPRWFFTSREAREQRVAGGPDKPFTIPHSSFITPPRSSSDNGATALLWCWLIGCTVLLSLASSKLVTYIWPVFPAVAILAAVGWGRLIDGTLSTTAKRMLFWTFALSCAAGPVVLPAALLVAQREVAIRFSWPIWVATAAAAAAATLPLLPLIGGRFRAAVSTGAVALAVQFAVVMTVVLPPVAATVSARDLANHFNRLGRLPPKLLVAESRIGSLVFYLEDDLRAGLRSEQLQRVYWHEFPAPEPGTLLALPECRVDRAARYVDLDGLPYESTGQHRLYHANDVARRQLRIVADHETTLRH